MSAEALLGKLDRVQKRGKDSWMACCAAHDDRNRSLSVRELPDGRVLVHCFAGCSVAEIVAAVGLELNDLFPPRDVENSRPERRPFHAADALRAVGFEAMVVVAAASALVAGDPIAEPDRERLVLASSRIQDAIRSAGL